MAETKLGGDDKYNLEDISMEGSRLIGRRWVDRPGYPQGGDFFSRLL